MTSEYSLPERELKFDDAISAQEFAKQNPGTVVTRNPDGGGYIVANRQALAAKPRKQAHNKYAPSEILNHLNEHVIAQYDAKEEIALALYYHHQKYKMRKTEIIRNNGPLMLIGPTGTGKTFMVQKACEHLEMPFIHVNTASVVPEGYKGYSMSNLMNEILESTRGNLDKAKHAIVFFDEVDKLFAPDDTSEDFYIKVVHQMLRMIEGDEIKLYSPVIVDDEEIDALDTTHMQFIFGGAFQWLLDDREYSAPVMGFGNQKSAQIQDVLSVEDLYASGVAKEFLGRVSTVVSLYPLTEQNIYDVLTQSKSGPIKKYVDKIRRNGCQVFIPDLTYKKIAKETARHPLGVRSLDFILKKLFKEALFESPLHHGKTYVIDYL